ncbi:MAG: SufS family cysteine desulfurase [Planctomycetota bacterium]|nr:MAG: SufS family cysteine desulfurase [Planctomycetota bacterium]
MPDLDQMTIDELIDEFEFLGEWEDQCQYLIELGKELPELPEGFKVDANLVPGCQARVWFVPEVHTAEGATEIDIRAKSDAMIVDGLIVVLLTLYGGKTPEEILAIDPQEVFARLGLETHLVPQRRNGLHAMVRRIREIAESHQTAAAPAEALARPASPSLSVSAPEGPGAGIERLNAHEVRRQFPALLQTLPSGTPITYLDTASSAQKPQCVIDAETEVYEQYYANAYRGVYRFGDRVSRELEESRTKVAQFLGAGSPQEVVFTAGTTAAINLVANAWGRKFLKPGDEILVSVLEHHANLVPWQWIAQQTGAILKSIPLTADGRLDMERLNEVLTDRTRLVAVTGMSNVLGTVPPVHDLVRKAHERGARVLVDAAQSAPHLPVNVRNEEVDFLAFSGHKLYGPSGVGVLYGRRELLEEMDPFLCGGHMIERVELEGFTCAPLPAKFEAGTPPIAQAIALGTAVDFVTGLGLCNIHTHEQTLLRYAMRRLEEIPEVTTYGPATAHKGAIISFTMEGAASQDVAQLLDLKGVCVRHGHHCTMPLHSWLNVPATVRASFACYNTTDDVDTLIDGLQFVREKAAR